MGTCFGDVKDVKLVNHQVHGVKLVIYQLAKCVNSFCLCVKTSVHMYKMLRVKGPSNKDTSNTSKGPKFRTTKFNE